MAPDVRRLMRDQPRIAVRTKWRRYCQQNARRRRPLPHLPNGFHVSAAVADGSAVVLLGHAGETTDERVTYSAAALDLAAVGQGWNNLQEVRTTRGCCGFTYTVRLDGGEAFKVKPANMRAEGVGGGSGGGGVGAGKAKGKGKGKKGRAGRK
jgi:hypothetical protein